jgi:hypothetical protein
MAIELNKKKNFSKTADKKALKAQDETIQITRVEWESMQESLSQLQNFMNDLVEGNLEIEIIDDEKEAAEPKDDDMKDIEIPEETEEVEIEEVEPKEESEDEEDEEKAEDADLVETLKDPAKRKAVMEFLKATDSRAPFQYATMNAVRKRIIRALEKTGANLESRKRALDSIMIDIKTKKENGIVIENEVVKKAVYSGFKKASDGYSKDMMKKQDVKKKQDVMQDKDKDQKMSMEQYVKKMVKPGMTDDQLDGIIEKICKKYDCKISKAIALVRAAQEGQKLEDSKKKKDIKKKTLSKGQDSLVPDFTSRFTEEKPVKKSLDKSDKTENLSAKFLSRFD